MVAKAASSKRASKRTLNAENLKTLGAPRLAELLMDLTENDPAAKRRLRLELAAADSPAAVARLARTRLGNLAKAKTNIGWKQMPALYREMEAHHDIIVRTAKEVPALGLELLWLFIAAATSVRDRCGFDRSDFALGQPQAAPLVMTAAMRRAKAWMSAGGSPSRMRA